MNPLLRNDRYYRILSRMANTLVLEEKHKFNDIFNIRTFKENIPIREYDDFKCYIKVLMQGEENMLWKHACKMVCQKQRHHQR